LKIPIFTDDPGWHGAQLKQAFQQHGVEAIFVSLQQCVTHISSTSTRIEIPGLDALPSGAFVRGISGGTLQQVITRLNVLHILALQGVKIYNDGRAVERTVDKALTSFLLQQQGIPTPETWVCESRHAVESIRAQAAKNKHTLIIKPLFGSQGLGVRQLHADAPLPVPMQQFVDGVYYLQTMIETPEFPHDYRIFVINKKVVAAMKRIGDTWVNNVAAGGRCENVEPNEKLTELALKATDALDIDYAGIDIIQDKNGEYFVLEVNSIPAWRGLQSVTKVNVAECLVADFLAKIADPSPKC
jgi:tetrahydromethanopterin:alpha-L-glutamate ligase